MLNKPAFFLAAMLCLAVTASFAQSIDPVTSKGIHFPSRIFGKIQSRMAGLTQQLNTQTGRYLQQMVRREAKMKQQLSAVDSAGASKLFANSPQQYHTLAQKLTADTGSSHQPIHGQYQPYTDTLQGAMTFLQQHPQLLAAPGSSPGQIAPEAQARIQGAASQLQAVQAKMQDAGAIQAYVQQRRQIIGDYISAHTGTAGILGKQYAALKQAQFYYGQQIQAYRDMVNNPVALEQKAIALLSQTPAFQQFMSTHSQLSGLLHLPGNYASTQAVQGLQTKDQIAQQVQSKVSAGGAAGASTLQSSLASAQSQLDGFKDKVSKWGAGSRVGSAPDFQPQMGKAKTFLGRLQYGFNVQSTHNCYYYPDLLALGVSVGYKIGNGSIIGIGGSYNMGLGNGISHIAVTSNGVSARSFLTVMVKGTWSVSGNFEYNYSTPFTNYQQLKQLQDWSKSGLIGLQKTISAKGRLIKQTTLSVLWDFLSYSQRPPTQPFIFRVGYNF
jgi:hypothetical protein